MKITAALTFAALLGFAALPQNAAAAGCISGAAVGGVAGHVAGHHGGQGAEPVRAAAPWSGTMAAKVLAL